jgi:hypothetical protein
MQRVLRAAPALGAIGLALAGCGATRRPAAAVTSTSRAPSSELSHTAPASVRRRDLPAGVDTLRGSGAELQHGARAVGVVFQIRSAGPRIYDSSATADISIEVSSGSVTPVLATRGVCKTPVEDFDRYITSGEDRVGCVVFAIDDAAAVDAVRFAPHSRTRRALTWAG